MPIKLLGALCFFMLSSFCLSIGLMPPSVAPKKAVRSIPRTKGMGGHEIGLMAPAKKVAILAPVLSVYAAIDEGLGHVTAVARNIQKEESISTLGHVFPKLTSLPVVGTSGAGLDPERILLLKPDALVTWGVQPEALRKAGYRSVVELRYSSRQSITRIWALLGRLAGQETESAQLLQNAEIRQRELHRMLPSNGRKESVLPMGVINDVWWIGRKDYYMNTLIEHANAANPARDLWFHGPTSPEVILRLDPDFIVMHAFTHEDVPARIYDDPQWQALRAVRQRHVYLMPLISSPLLNIPVDETLLLTWLAEVLHPSLPHMTRAAYREIYAKTYHYDLSDDEIDEALFLKENAGSAGYERFARGLKSSTPLAGTGAAHCLYNGDLP